MKLRYHENFTYPQIIFIKIDKPRSSRTQGSRLLKDTIQHWVCVGYAQKWTCIINSLV